MKIHVVCGAGASSTFVAARLRRAVQAAGSGWDVQAATLLGVDPWADVILLGPHIGDHRDRIAHGAPHAVVIVLPEDVFTDLDGTRVLALVQTALTQETASKGMP